MSPDASMVTCPEPQLMCRQLQQALLRAHAGELLHTMFVLHSENRTVQARRQAVLSGGLVVCESWLVSAARVLSHGEWDLHSSFPWI